MSVTIAKYYAAMSQSRKDLGQYFTPSMVAQTLTNWVVRSRSDLLLDPSCGDGVFLVNRPGSVGVELDRETYKLAKKQVPHSQIWNDDFFKWAARTALRFDALVGNPPFIRYQRFKGEQRSRALNLAASAGVKFSGLTSSWAPFLVCAAELLKIGGRMAFVVPAEIGHSTYVPPLIEYLTSHFGFVHVVAIREKLFPDISEDAWLLYCEKFGSTSKTIAFSAYPEFQSINPRKPQQKISILKWRVHGSRLRKFLIGENLLDKYEEIARRGEVVRLGQLASTGIGYVTGDNAFFHLRPSEAKKRGIPEAFLKVAIRKGEQLNGTDVDVAAVKRWRAEDREVLLLNLDGTSRLPAPVTKYLESAGGRRAREAFKCRTRNPWYVVPDVRAPDAFLSYMNGDDSVLALNKADCVCTNSLLAIRFRNGADQTKVVEAWSHPLSRLSQELEGHPLGGGMLKLEPGEAAGVLVPTNTVRDLDLSEVKRALRTLRQWRHAKLNGNDSVS